MKHAVDIYFSSMNDAHKVNQDFDKTINIGVEKDFLTTFADHIHPQITFNHKIYVFDHDWQSTDRNTHTTDIQKLLRSPYIQHIFYEDPDKDGRIEPKVDFLPMGLETRALYNWEPRGNYEHVLKIIQEQPPLHQRHIKAVLCFGADHWESAGDHPQNRNRAHKSATRPNSGIENIPTNMSYLDYRKKMGEYAFAIAPFGRGLDCHRTWELLQMRTIPIVESSQLDPLYTSNSMPVVIVNNWDDITEEKLHEWLPIYAAKFHAPHPQLEPYLTCEYWLNK